MLFSSCMVAWSCTILPPWIPERISEISLRDKDLKHTHQDEPKITGCAFLVIPDSRFAPSSCTDSLWSMLQSCRVATFSMVSSITSFKSVNLSLKGIRNHYVTAAYRCVKENLSTVNIAHLSCWLNGPQCHHVATWWKRPKCRWQIIQSVHQSAV